MHNDDYRARERAGKVRVPLGHPPRRARVGAASPPDSHRAPHQRYALFCYVLLLWYLTNASQLTLWLLWFERVAVEESTSKRVSFYGTLECVVYLLICVLQVFYIKSLLDNPNKARTWA